MVLWMLMPGEKFLMVSWLLIPVAVLSALVHGWDIDNVRGRLLVGCLPASLLASVSAFVATFVDKPIARFSKHVWVVVAVLSLLAAFLLASEDHPSAFKDTHTVLVYVLMLLAFPISSLVPFVLMGIGLWTDLGGFSYLTMMWLLFVVPGYVQWFVLLPWLRRKGEGKPGTK